MGSVVIAVVVNAGGQASSSVEAQQHPVSNNRHRGNCLKLATALAGVAPVIKYQPLFYRLCINAGSVEGSRVCWGGSFVVTSQRLVAGRRARRHVRLHRDGI